MTSTDYTATGGIDTQALGNGVINNFTYDALSNRLDCIYTPVCTRAKPGLLVPIDLSYLAANFIRGGLLPASADRQS